MTSVNTKSLIEIEAVGPALTSSDSRRVETTLSCTGAGVAVTATITRSASYSGSFLKNGPWRPTLSISAVPARSDAVITVIWEMNLSNGDRVRKTDLGQTFPFSVTKTVSLPN
jgi:hypothetical protein